MAISSNDIIIPLTAGPRGQTISVGAVAIPLNEVELAICSTLHCSPAQYAAMKQKRRAGQQPAAWGPGEGAVTANGPVSRFYERQN